MLRARHGRLTDAYVENLGPKENGCERIVRDGALPGFLVRVGARKRSFELRIEKRPRVTRGLGHWPDVSASAARRLAEQLWEKHRRGELLNESQEKRAETLLSTWPLFEARLHDQMRSHRTIGGYGDLLNRLSDEVKNLPLRELAADPIIMEREVTRIRELLRDKRAEGERRRQRLRASWRWYFALRRSATQASGVIR